MFFRDLRRRLPVLSLPLVLLLLLVLLRVLAERLKYAVVVACCASQQASICCFPAVLQPQSRLSGPLHRFGPINQQGRRGWKKNDNYLTTRCRKVVLR